MSFYEPLPNAASCGQPADNTSPSPEVSFWVTYSLVVVALVVFGASGMLHSIAAFRAANATKEDLQLRREAETSQSQLVTSLHMKSTIAQNAQAKLEDKIKDLEQRL